jgi:hypothetical protein
VRVDDQSIHQNLGEHLVAYFERQPCACSENRDDGGRFKPHETYCPKYLLAQSKKLAKLQGSTR